MKHKKGNKKLNKPTDQRLALIKNTTFHLIKYSAIKTPLTRAKQVIAYAEHLVSIARTDTVNSRREVFKKVNNKDFVKDLFSYAATVKDKKSGFFRVTPIGLRKGDAAPLALIEQL